MRGKGLIQFFAVALILVCIYQLSFTIVVNKVEDRAQVFAEIKITKGKNVDAMVPAGTNKLVYEDSINELIRKAKQDYLDSIANEKVFNLGIISFSYEKCKAQQLSLGLDLKGGMNVVLQVSMEDLIRNMSDQSTDPYFNKALEDAKGSMANNPNKDLVTLFGESYQKIAPSGQLASIFATRENQGKIKITDDNATVLKVIKSEADDAFNRTYNILRTRIDKFGVSQPSITPQPSSGRIVVELPGVDNPQRVRNLLQAAAKLEFWETYENAEVYSYLQQANTAIKERGAATVDTTAKNSAPKAALLSSNDTAKASQPNSAKSSKKDSTSLSLLNSADTSKKKAANVKSNTAADNPLFAVLQPAIYRDEQNNYQLAPGCIVGNAQGTDTIKINRFLSLNYVKAIFPKTLKFLWGSKPTEQDKKRYYLYAIKMKANSDQAPLQGDAVIDARQDFDQNGKPEISMRMNSEGARTWKVLTGQNVGKDVAIVLDNYVESAPRVEGEIAGGNSSITGNFAIDEAKDLANILKAGKLPAPAKIIGEEVVGPSLGETSINAGIRSIVIAFVAILAFMILYYSNSGIIADAALFFNLFFLIGVLASIGATLTLSGIAGIVLTMGMAVDANVLIHERIKEELAKGKSLIKAVNDGHTKSYSAVFDTHITTLITGLILAYFGLGPVLGYATTLNYGIVLTLFTMVFLSHLIFNYFIERGYKINFSTTFTKNYFKNTNIQFVNKRKYAYIFSGTLAIIGLISIFTKGFDYGVDFLGGRSYVIRFDQPVNTTTIANELTVSFGSRPVVKTFGTNDQVKITTAFKVSENTSTGDSLANLALYHGLQKQLSSNVTYDVFKSKYELSSQVVGPSISRDIENHAFYAIAFALLGIFLYILIRFRRWQFALGAIVSLFHDVLMVMGLYSIFSRILPFSLEVDETFVAAVLTVMGYSVNDTVIVFDRIREYLREHAAGEMKTVINDALNATLSRTIITSTTVLLVLLILFIFGGDVIRGFSFALLIGILFGTYSSIFVATPIVVDLTRTSTNKGTNGGKSVSASSVKPAPAKP
jgi:SecD/SecF fusion protein